MPWHLAEHLYFNGMEEHRQPRTSFGVQSWATSWCIAMFVATVPPREPLSRALLLRLMRPFGDTKY
jgi:hypothetical protein